MDDIIWGRMMTISTHCSPWLIGSPPFYHSPYLLWTFFQVAFMDTNSVDHLVLIAPKWQLVRSILEMKMNTEHVMFRSCFLTCKLTLCTAHVYNLHVSFSSFGFCHITNGYSNEVIYKKTIQLVQLRFPDCTFGITLPYVPHLQAHRYVTSRHTKCNLQIFGNWVYTHNLSSIIKYWGCGLKLYFAHLPKNLNYFIVLKSPTYMHKRKINPEKRSCDCFNSSIAE